MVAEAGAAVGPELLGKAGGLLAAGREGGVGEPILHVIHQLVGGGDLQHKNKVFYSRRVWNAVLDLPPSSSSSRARRASAGSRPG